MINVALLLHLGLGFTQSMCSGEDAVSGVILLYNWYGDRSDKRILDKLKTLNLSEFKAQRELE